MYPRVVMKMVLVFLRLLVKKIRKQRNIALSVVLFVASCVIFFLSDWSPDLYYLTVDAFEDVSCYYSHSNDRLPQITDDFNPPAKSIHFHETSCRGRLNSRQACAVESAARVHPHWQVNLFFLGPVTEENMNMKSFLALKKYENIKIMRVHLVDYAKGTPLEELVSSGGLNKTRWRISHTSDAMRFLSLYKWAGIYLDLDMVVVRSFEDLAMNWAARETQNFVAAGALAFSTDALGREIAETAIRNFKENFRGDTWSQNGPGVITRILRNRCNSSWFHTNMSAATCKGFEVYGPELFYPISYSKANDYFEDKELPAGNPYTYHVWNKFTQDYTVNKNSAYAKLAKKYCPAVYEQYGDNFGL